MNTTSNVRTVSTSLQNTVQLPIETNGVFAPQRPISSAPDGAQSQFRAVQVAVSKLQTAQQAATAALVPAPAPAINLAATESPYKTADGSMVSLVSVSFTEDDANFASADIYLTGYHGANTLQFATNGTASPISFLLDTTHERVTITLVAKNSSGLSEPIPEAPTTSVTLDGVTSAPPPPSIAEALTSSLLGYTFAWNVEGGLVADVISGYNIYRATSDNFSAATVVQHVSQPTTNTGAIEFGDTMPADASTAYYYWVTALDTSGLKSTPTSAGNATANGVPQQVTGVSAVEAPFLSAAGERSLVSVDFSPMPNDPYFDIVETYFSGYNGNPNPQLMAQGSLSPIQFLCETTYETVIVTVVAVSANGIASDFASAPTVMVTLDGVQTVPPSPSIAESQTALAGDKGWQFAINVIGGMDAAAGLISGYRIYHSESNEPPAPGSSYFTAYPQPSTNYGTITVQEVTPDILFYWVSSYNSAGFESVLTPVPFVYVDPGASAPSIPAPVQTTPKPFLPKLTMNGWAANVHAGNYEGGGSLGSEVWGTNGTATLAYTSPISAYDANQATAASCSEAHTHQYAGCIWDFSGFPGLSAGASVVSAQVSVVSQVSPTSGPVAGHADIWYSLDGGSTWSKLYAAYAARIKQTDTINLSASQDLTKIQVMAFLDSHDDIAHSVFEISLSITQSAPAGPEKVTGVQTTLASGDVQITWNSLTPVSRADILSYEITRVVHGGGYAQSKVQTTVAWTGAASYSWTDPEAHDGTFDYYVVANNSTGAGQPSDVANLAGAASLIYTSGQTVESLQPAQAGADVTGSNTAADTLAVNGIQSHLISPISALMPSEAGADVTSNNVALDTSAVSGTPSSTVSLATTGQQRNLIPDSDLKFGSTYWQMNPELPIVPGAGADGGNAFVYTGTGSPATPQFPISDIIQVVPGQTYTLSAYMDTTAVTAGAVTIAVYSLNIQTYYGGINAGPSFKGRSSTGIVIPAGVTQVVIICDTNTATVDAGGKVIFSNLQLEVGSVATAYKPNVLDDTTGYLRAGASQIDFASNVHLNRSIDHIPDGTTRFAAIQAGADKTSLNGNILLENPTFASGNTGWTSDGSGWNIIAGAGYGGSAYLASYTGIGSADFFNNQQIPCSAGALLSSSCFIEAVASAPVTVTNSLSGGHALSQYVAAPIAWTPGSDVTFNVNMNSGGGIIDVLFYASNGASGPNGYFARIDTRAAQNLGQILICTNGTWTSIGTAVAAKNSVVVTGTHTARMSFGAGGAMSLYVDGVLQWTATDTTYTPTGALYYGSEVVSNETLSFAASGDPSVSIRFYNASGAVLGTSYGTAGTANAWNQSRVVATAPATTAYATVGASVQNGNGGAWSFGGFSAAIHLNSQDELPDGTSFARVQASHLTENQIDLSLAYLNKTLDHIADSELRFAAAEAGANKTETRVALQASNLTNHTTSDLAEADGLFYALEHGADITGNHTANDSAYLNGIASHLISPISALMPAEAGANVTETRIALQAANLNNHDTSSLTEAAGLYYAAQHGADVTAQAGSVLLQNPNFAAGNVGWGLGSWEIIPGTPAIPGSSGYICQLTSAVAANHEIDNNQRITVGAGAVISASCWINGASGATGSAHVFINAFDAAGNYLGTAFAPPITSGTGAWIHSRVTWIMPAGTYSAVVGCAVQSAVGTWSLSGFTASLLPSSLDEVPDGANHLRIPTTIYGPSGNAVDTSGNLKLKNKRKVQSSGSQALTSTWTPLPSLGSSNGEMAYLLMGNPVLVSVKADFIASSSGGQVTSIGYVPPSSVPGPPPNIVITISGDGSGAGASVSWSTSDQGQTFQSHLNLGGGSGYTYAACSVSGSPSGNGSYSCSVSQPQPVANALVNVQTLMDGNSFIDPVQLTTDASGRARYSDLELDEIAAGTHVFQVEVMGATSVQFLDGSFGAIELG